MEGPLQRMKNEIEKKQQDYNFEKTIKIGIEKMYYLLMNPVIISEILALINGFLKIIITVFKKYIKKFMNEAHSEVKSSQTKIF